MDRRWRAILQNALACKVMAVLMLLLCIYAVLFNLYNASGGNLFDIETWKLCFTDNEWKILLLGIGGFAFFMISSENAKKMQEENQEWEAGDETITEDEAVIPKKQKCTLCYQGVQVTFYVPEDASPVEVDTQEDSEKYGFISATYYTKDINVVNCYLYIAGEDVGLNAKEYIEGCLAELPENTKQKIQIEQMIIDGHVCFYFVANYKDKTYEYYEIYMACDVAGNGIFSVETESVDRKHKLSIADIKDLFYFENSDS